jgi:hypothetical protein
LLSGEADGLTGKPAADEVNRLKVCTRHLSDIAVARHVGPVSFEHAVAIGVVFDLPAHTHARAL